MLRARRAAPCVAAHGSTGRTAIEHGFHTHGHHEHHLEHAAQAGESLAQRIAVLTAILSTIGAVFAYAGGARQTEAMLLKNEALLRKAEADDQWAYYQSKSQKQALAELSAQLTTGDAAAKHQSDVQRYEEEKKEIQEKAKALDGEARQLNEESARQIRPHERLSQAMTAMQISIALASVAALTRRKWLVGLAIAAAVAGAGLGAVGWFG
jgi:hypothetical protein